MKEEMVSLSVDTNVVNTIIQKQIATAIADGLGGADALVEKMVKAALSVKVSHDGTTSRYSSDNKYDFIEAVVMKELQSTARMALKEWVAENSTKIKDVLVKELARPSNNRKLANAFAAAVVDSVRCSWVPNIEFKFDAKDK